MKYALFEFVSEKSCEVGETRWIVRENSETFNNSQWDWEKEVMVSWPQEFAKINKKIIKNSIDPKTLPTTTCVAKVIQFSGKLVDECVFIVSKLNTWTDECY